MVYEVLLLGILRHLSISIAKRAIGYNGTEGMQFITEHFYLSQKISRKKMPGMFTALKLGIE